MIILLINVGGFTNVRKTATKTSSLVDRLQAIELPAVDDVVVDRENYLRAIKRAGNLDEGW